MFPPERLNPSEERLVMNAHIVGSIQQHNPISREDQDFLKEIFYDTKNIRYCDLSTSELSKLRTDVVSYCGIESGLINPNKEAVI
mgnify:FL=1